LLKRLVSFGQSISLQTLALMISICLLMQLNAPLLSSPPNESPDENFLRSPLVMPHQQVVRHTATKLQWYIQLQSYSDKAAKGGSWCLCLNENVWLLRHSWAILSY